MSKLNHTSPTLWATILIITLSIAGFSASTLLSHDSIAENHDNPIATLTNTDITKSSANTTDEMVYVITDKTGKSEKILANSFTENQLNETAVVPKTDLPITFTIQYTLNDTTISATDLAGKSGHVTITYDFTNHQKYGNYYIPFATITTAVLNENFSNVTVTNGRILDDGAHKVVLGLTFPGLNHNFSTNLDLPTTFTISADVTNFQLESTYTLANNQIFSELDTTPLSTIDELASAMDQLSSSMSQLITGSSQLQSGLQQLLDKSSELVNGVNQLNDGLRTLSSKSGELNTGAAQVFQAIIDSVNNELTSNADLATLQATLQAYIHSSFDIPTLTISDYSTQLTNLVNTLNHYASATAAISPALSAACTNAANIFASTKSNLDNINTFYTGLRQYTTGVNTAANGSQQLANNLPSLTNGITALRDGSVKLTQGLKAFNSQGITQLVNTANKAENFANDLRATINASKTYTHFSQPTAQQVNFIYKTPSI